jgi:phosphoribosylanthranilate isomerase
LTRVKICGITETVHARAATEAGADFIGVVIAPSPRQVTPDKAREIMAVIKDQNFATPVVGVFVNTPAPTVNFLATYCGLDWVQLSGNETWEYCQHIEKPMIKAIHISAECTEDELLGQLESGRRLLSTRPPVFLLDTFVEKQYGGTGQAFPWEIARQAAAEFPVIIAGGLNSENVGQVITSLQPWGVDVSSGVEDNGAKSVKKIRAFINAARSAQ